MYNVNINGRTAASESSYAKAVSAAKAAIPAVSDAIAAKADAIRANGRLYRSPKVRANAANTLLARAARAIDGLKFPKTASDVSLDIAGVSLSIHKA